MHFGAALAAGAQIPNLAARNASEVAMSHSTSTNCSPRLVWAAKAAIGCVLALSCQRGVIAQTQEAEWIWAPPHQKDAVPERATCHFRRTFEVSDPQQAQITIAADDRYELFLNGQRLGIGESAKQFKTYEIGPRLKRGRNTLAVRVTNLRGPTAALAARVLVRNGEQWVDFSTNEKWSANLNVLPLWQTPFYNDRRWPAARSFGKLGETVPWDREEGVASQQQDQGNRFSISKEFEVVKLLEGELTGSLIAMAFNEFGHIIASREGGPLILIYKSDPQGSYDQVRVYCDKVTNAHGILALNGDVYVTAEGPDGNGLYRLSDTDRDGTLEKVQTLLQFKSSVSEHGVHGLTLGPDGYLYVVLGNHAKPLVEYAKSSPHRNAYEGELLRPRYEDPSGHANGVKAPGGVVIRTDTNGRAAELVAGGLRNAFDLTFSPDGELFVHDSDMESDLGTTWYRPTRLLHVAAGGEYGWRSGWAKWPEFYFDSLPAAVETDRGSPTGGAVYDHFMFPIRYHGALFLADWSEGRILAVRLKRTGATYVGQAEVFLTGTPLNVCDLEVGPDGALYFITGGRGTQGGVYRVAWRGQVPESYRNLGEGISKVIRQPQLNSAWARQQIATEKRQLGSNWESKLAGVASSTGNPANYRTRALDVMQLFGPPPSSQLLVSLATDENAEVRSKAAALMGIHPEGCDAALVKLLSDEDRLVRRHACEAARRAGLRPPVDQVLPLLASDDRFESWAARKLLESLPVDSWRERVLNHKDQRIFLQGALALVIEDPAPGNSLKIVERVEEFMDGFISDRNFTDMLRLTQVALERGEVEPERLTRFQRILSEEFPAGNALLNREIARLLVYMQTSSIMDRYLNYLESDVPDVEKLSLALQLRYLKDGWTTEQRMKLLGFYQALETRKGGNSYLTYVRHVSRDFAKQLTPEEAIQVIDQGPKWPSAALGALYCLPDEISVETAKKLIALDEALPYDEEADDQTVLTLKTGIMAVLSQCGHPEGQAHLRTIWEKEPKRRVNATWGLAQDPDGRNWSYLVRSLPIIDGDMAMDVFHALRQVPKAPQDPEHLRQLLLCGLRLKDPDACKSAFEVLEYWTGEVPAEPDAELAQVRQAWQDWWKRAHPSRPEAQLPVAEANNKWEFDELLQFLTSDDGRQGTSAEGAKIFAQAQCAKCHRFGDQGEPLGPDLNSIARRFTTREILQSIIFPSHVISDQYAAHTLITTSGKTYAGLAVAQGDEWIVLQADGTKVTLAKDDVEQMTRSRTSAMPAGLLNDLTLDQIADLFAYLGTTSQTPSIAREPERESSTRKR